MHKLFAFLIVGSLLFAACASDNPTIEATGGTATGGTGATAPATAAGTGETVRGGPCARARATAAECAAANEAAFFAPGVLTVGTDFGFMFPPWILKNDPTAGQGFEAAMDYEGARTTAL